MKENKIYQFLYCFLLSFVFFSIAGLLLPFLIDVVMYFIHKDGSLFNPVPLKYFVGTTVCSFFFTVYYLWNIVRK